jgi:pimeloyl-ACP methyl ester carboxylesterase
MPKVFVHGVPDTPAVWRPLLDRLRLPDGDAVTLALPGFGNTPADAFPATKDAYAHWLITELHRLPRPLDLVAHDWGALLTLRVVSLEPNLVHSWALGAAPLDPEYEWHRAAKLWQTPDVGEEVMEKTTPEALAHNLATVGVPAEAAAETGRHWDPTMKRSILALYRSAVRAWDDWGADLARVTAPGLVLWGETDPYAAVRFGERLAQRVNARFVALRGCGHWWQLEQPDAVAAELRAFWGLTR